tara:strand:- start:257 stop:424 length:168 start_codon:yes stop_codon:yes gene_type:complete
MDFSHGLGLFFIGTSITITGFFIAFLVINHNQKKEKQKLKDKKNPMHNFWGDDTV